MLKKKLKLDGEVALITGSSRGIGRAIALAMAKEGANIIITYNTQKGKAEKVVLEIKKIGSKAIAAQMNVSDRKNVQQTKPSKE